MTYKCDKVGVRGLPAFDTSKAANELGFTAERPTRDEIACVAEPLRAQEKLS